MGSSQLSGVGLAAADVVATLAEGDAAFGADHFVIFANAATANRAEGNRGTTAIHNPRGDQASGDDLLAPAFSFNEGSHDVLLSSAMWSKCCPGHGGRVPRSGQEVEGERNRRIEMQLPGKRM